MSDCKSDKKVVVCPRVPLLYSLGMCRQDKNVVSLEKLCFLHNMKNYISEVLWRKLEWLVWRFHGDSVESDTFYGNFMVTLGWRLSGAFIGKTW